MQITGRLLFYTFLVLLPVQLGRHFWPEQSFVNGIRIDYLSPTIYATDILIFVLAIVWLYTIKRHQFFFTFLVAGIYIGMSTQNHHVLPTLAKLLTLSEMIFLAVYIRTERPDVTVTGLCLCIASLWSSLLAWLQFATQHSLGEMWWFAGERTFTVSTPGIARILIEGDLMLRPYATFPHPNVLAGFLIISSPLIYSSMRSAHIPQWLRYGAMFFIASTILISFSRSAWIAGILMVATTGIYVVSRQGITQSVLMIFHHKKIILIASVCLALLIPVFIQRFEELFTTDNQSISHRVLLMSAARSMVREHPIIGVGLNRFIPMLPQYISITSAGDLQPVHNVFLLVASETGAFGLGLFLFFGGKTYINIWHARKKSPYAFPFFLSLIALFVVGMFDHYIYTIHQTQLLVGIIVGFSMNIDRQSGKLTV